jgi:hemerythrin-like metal-binding protein
MCGMQTLQWTASHAVFVTEIDDEHRNIFQALADVESVLASGSQSQLRKAAERLTSQMAAHFAHEERLMRAARYRSLRWHKRRHDGARKRVAGLLLRIDRQDPVAGPELVDYLTSWLHDHTLVADRMMAAALRNHRRSMWTMTFTAGTKPLDACDWVTVSGDPLEPPTRG